jgi:hypothetical protein
MYLGELGGKPKMPDPEKIVLTPYAGDLNQGPSCCATYNMVFSRWISWTLRETTYDYTEKILVERKDEEKSLLLITGTYLTLILLVL